MKINKPWGYENIIETNDKYTFKLLFMKANNRCSLQYHCKKMETIYVQSGVLKVTCGADEQSLFDFILTSGSYFTIEPGTIHRMEALEDSMYFESSTSELDDVVRIQDDYNR